MTWWYPAVVKLQIIHMVIHQAMVNQVLWWLEWKEQTRVVPLISTVLWLTDPCIATRKWKINWLEAPRKFYFKGRLELLRAPKNISSIWILLKPVNLALLVVHRISTFIRVKSTIILIIQCQLKMSNSKVFQRMLFMKPLWVEQFQLKSGSMNKRIEPLFKEVPCYTTQASLTVMMHAALKTCRLLPIWDKPNTRAKVT